MAKVTITIEDVPGDKPKMRVLFCPAVDLADGKSTPALDLARILCVKANEVMNPKEETEMSDEAEVT